MPMYGPSAFVSDVHHLVGNVPELETLRRAFAPIGNTKPANVLHKAEKATMRLMGAVAKSRSKAGKLAAYWHKYRRWHWRNGEKAFAPSKRRPEAIRDIPHDVLRAHVLPLLANKDVMHLALSLKEAPVHTELERRQATVIREVRDMISFGAMCVRERMTPERYRDVVQRMEAAKYTVTEIDPLGFFDDDTWDVNARGKAFSVYIEVFGSSRNAHLSFRRLSSPDEEVMYVWLDGKPKGGLRDAYVHLMFQGMPPAGLAKAIRDGMRAFTRKPTWNEMFYSNGPML